MINIKNKYLPRDTQEIFPKQIKEYKNFNFWYCFNSPDIFYDRKGKLKIKINPFIEKFRWDKEWLKNIEERNKKFIREFEKAGFKKETFSATVSWRMVIGLGSTHPQETSMTLHHIYGIPYIPGSAVKGVTRHWVILKYFEGDEKKAEEDEKFKKIFGTQKQAGEVIFCDAYPVEDIKLKVDVMTPHYPDYYSGDKPPADWQQPKPINFLAVDRGTKFKFYLLSKDEKILEQSKKWLEEALKEFGIGAKTSVGYGYFEIEE